MFSKLTQTLLLSCILAFSSFAAHANTHVYDKIVVFGDSLSDNGNLFKWSGLPEKPYFEGRFSNGTVWIEMVAKALNLDTSSKYQFADYAYGGAWAADAEDGEGGLVPLSLERSMYFDEVKKHPEENAHIDNSLFVIWIGNNDYLQDGRLNEDANVAVNRTINAIKTHIDLLIENGARHFLILNLPDLGKTPKAQQSIEHGHPEYATSISTLALLHNIKLNELIQQEAQAHSDMEFISFDLAMHFADLTQHPEKYNIKNVTTPCFPNGIGKFDVPTRLAAHSTKKFNLNGLSVDLNHYPDLMAANQAANKNQQQQYDYCLNTSDYLFWDYVHPTAFAHELIAEFVSDLLINNKA